MTKIHDLLGHAAVDTGDNIFYLDEIAQVCHAVNKAFCDATGDTSQVNWKDAPEWQRTSAIAGVRAALDGTANSPQEQHAAWAAAKYADGWVYGPVKDAEAKAHPALVPYDALPQEQKIKDFLFRAVIESMSTLNSEVVWDRE